MSLIRFYANKLPFKPLERQVIFFDVNPMSIKMGYHIVQLINRHYDEIRQMFEARGLEFCFLPRISQTLSIPELYAYFHPDEPNAQASPYLPQVNTDNLARYFANEQDLMRIPMGVIKYSGQQFGNDYIFNFFPFVENGDQNRLMNIDEQTLYIMMKRFLDYHAAPSFSLLQEDDIPALEPSDNTDPEDVGNMLTQAQTLVTKLRNQGVNDLIIDEIFHPTRQPSRLHIHHSRVYLTDYQNMEIRMSPLPRAVFLLYLKHPEGIRFCDLPDYRDELFDIYADFSGRDSIEGIRASIDDLTNPLSNSINEKCSRIRLAFISKIEERLARNYYITGERGSAKRITLPRELVTWE
ncbi:MAG: hypothetical protein IKH26_03655 [Bacteroidaceae bacterium]|nr:hypothetical protein [Bacteroidaceae bacterium]